MTVVLATFREDLAGYVYAVFVVYTLLIIAYILSSLFFAFGGRLPYSRWSSAASCSSSAARMTAPWRTSTGVEGRMR